MSGSSGVNISTESLRLAGTLLREVGDELDRQLTALENELRSFGEPWGNDNIGQLIGAAYQEVVSFAFDCLRNLLNEIRESGTDLGGMADTYEQMEQDLISRFQALTERLGSG